jgi:hypothetical protein
LGFGLALGLGYVGVWVRVRQAVDALGIERRGASQLKRERILSCAGEDAAQ